MVFVAPDILADACGLSLGLTVVTLLTGLVLWLFGWWCHRFWVVLLTTVLGGTLGLYEAPTFQAQPVVASILLAVAAGLLALALVRLLAFVAGGLTGLLLVQGFFPALQQPLLCFVACGLVCLFLFRPCMMALTSLCGALLLHYGGLMLLHRHGTLDVIAWSEQASVLLNMTCAGLTLAGLALQFFLDRQFGRKDDARASGSDEGLGRLIGWFGREERRAA